MDKASIIKDAIEYIQVLHEQEKALRAEIAELEEERLRNPVLTADLENEPLVEYKKKRASPSPSSSGRAMSPPSSIDIVEVSLFFPFFF